MNECDRRRNKLESERNYKTKKNFLEKNNGNRNEQNKYRNQQVTVSGSVNSKHKQDSYARICYV